MLAAAVGLVAWALYMWGHARFPMSNLVAQLTGKSAESAKPPSNGNPTPVHKGRAGSTAHLSAVRTSRFPTETTTMVVTLPPFPTRQSLRTGTALAQMRQTFGEPIINVSELKAGHLFERWYYVNHDNTAMTVATLDDGFVSSVETLPKTDFGVHIHAGPSGG